MVKLSNIELLRQWRLKEDLSYRVLAEAIGISPMALHNLLNGVSQPTERTSFKIDNYLKSERVTL